FGIGLRLNPGGEFLSQTFSADIPGKRPVQVSVIDPFQQLPRNQSLGQKTEFLAALSETLMLARKSLSDVQGTITMRRLNRREYRNTIRDLLGLEINVQDLPSDAGAGNFDTVGSSLFMSSDQFEQYLALGRQALDEHFARILPGSNLHPGHGQSKPAVTHRFDPETVATPHIEKQLKHHEGLHEKFARWQVEVDRAAADPENQEILADLKKKDARLNTPGSVVLYYHADAFKGAPNPKDFGLGDASNAVFGNQQYDKIAPFLRHYLNLPNRNTGAYLTILEGHARMDVPLPASLRPGTYRLKIRAGTVPGTPVERHFLEIGTPDEGRIQWNLKSIASTHQVRGTVDHPEILEVPFAVVNSTPPTLSIRERQPAGIEAATAFYFEQKRKNGHGPDPAIWVDFVELDGPLPSATPASTLRERREVELHANAMVGGTYNGYYKGGYEAAKAYIATGSPQKGIPDELEAKFRIKVFEEHGPSFERYLNDPLTKTGAYLTLYNVHTEEVITLPPDQPSGWLKTKHEVEHVPPGEYRLRVRIGAAPGTPKERHFLEFGSRVDKDDFKLLHTFQIRGTTDEPEILEVPVSLGTDSPRTFVLREKRDVKLDHEIYLAAVKETKVGPVPALWIDWVEWEGPYLPATPISKREHIEPEKRRAEVERGHLRSKHLFEQYQKWQATGADESRLKEFEFHDKSHAEFAKVVWENNSRWFQQYLDRPLSHTGLFLDNTVQETSEYTVDLPTETPPGTYVMRARIGRVPETPADRAFLTLVQASPIDKDDRTFLANKQITAPLHQPETLEIPFQIRPGGPRKFVLMEKRPLQKETISLPGRTRQIADPARRDPALWIDWIEYEGPLPSSQFRPLLAPETVSLPEPERARAVLASFAQRAFRGQKPEPSFSDRLQALYETRRKSGEPWEVAIRTPLSVILASPGFLYLSEPGTEKKPRDLTQVELASRLSYFLWSAPPDDELLSANLADPAVLVGQVDRLMASEKAGEFVRGFVHQWLGMERLDFFQFDTKQFRDFDESAKAAARREVYETFAHLLRENGSLTRLLKSNEIFVNGLLATYYGIEGVNGDAFQKVQLQPGSPRGGLLGMAAILAMGSNGERTSPVERGAWVLRKLLHNPPPPAPPNVPQITRLENQLLNTRQRLGAHQEEPQCLQCHRKIDPIGFGLENFNAAGKWRTEETYEKRGVGKKTWPVDASGQFHNGPAFKDYFELRDRIAARPEAFARGFTEALIEYALGRPYGFTDAALADGIVARAGAAHFGVREFLVALITSREFARK
ncbi:MAG: hypothetical protein RLZZ253_84, partial [Verrucomicrobiota bacterium]